MREGTGFRGQEKSSLLRVYLIGILLIGFSIVNFHILPLTKTILIGMQILIKSEKKSNSE